MKYLNINIINNMFDVGRWRFLMSLSKNFNTNKDFYKILQVNKLASQQEIKKSFKKLAKLYHPDYNQGKQDQFKEINQAYQVLSSPQLKKQYDLLTKEEQSQRNRQTNQTNTNSNQTDFRNYGFQNQREHFRQTFRKFNQENLKEQAKYRKNYDDLGKSYAKYQQFKKETIKQKLKQGDRVTQESVKKQYDQHVKKQQQRQKEEIIKRFSSWSEKASYKPSALANGFEQIGYGLQKMGLYIKELFKQK